ncbi:hypothetical protein ACFL3R_00635 [Thermodesulfobacteriota bacterium]
MTTYNNVSHTTTSYDTIGVDSPLHGYGILVDEQLLFVDDQGHYVDGSVVYRDTLAYEPEIKCNNETILCIDRWTVNCDGTQVYVKEESDV